MSSVVTDFQFADFKDKSEKIYIELRKAAEELADSEASLKEFDDIHKTYLAKIALEIRDEYEKMPISIVDKMSLINENYEKFLKDLSKRRHRYLKAKYNWKVKEARYELHRSLGSIARSMLEKGL